MSSMTFGQKTFIPTPPDKGSFPLDHEGKCKESMLRYMICIKSNGGKSEMCRDLAQIYLQCRMDNNLMAFEKWDNLGFSHPPPQST